MISAKIYCTIKYKAIFSFQHHINVSIYTDVNIYLFTQDNTPYTCTINNKQLVGWKQNKLVFEYHMFLCTSYEQFTCTKNIRRKKNFKNTKRTKHEI